MNYERQQIYKPGRPGINRPTGENLVMDILGVAYEDFVQGEFTTVGKMISIIYKYYPEYNKDYLKRIINLTLESHWFNKSGPREVHIVERGVELYLAMKQNFRAEKWAQDNNIKAKWNIFFVIIGIFMTGLVIYLDLKK